MPGEIPEAGFPREASVDEHVEPVYSKEGRVALAPGENVESRVTESDVANDVGGLHELVQRLGYEVLSDVACETGDRRDAGGEDVVRVDPDSAGPGGNRDTSVNRSGPRGRSPAPAGEDPPGACFSG